MFISLENSQFYSPVGLADTTNYAATQQQLKETTQPEQAEGTPQTIAEEDTSEVEHQKVDAGSTEPASMQQQENGQIQAAESPVKEKRTQVLTEEGLEYKLNNRKEKKAALADSTL